MCCLYIQSVFWSHGCLPDEEPCRSKCCTNTNLGVWKVQCADSLSFSIVAAFVLHLYPAGVGCALFSCFYLSDHSLLQRSDKLKDCRTLLAHRGECSTRTCPSKLEPTEMICFYSELGNMEVCWERLPVFIWYKFFILNSTRW